MNGPRPSAGVKQTYLPDTEEFSASEIAAMDKAYELFNSLNHDDLYAYFHSPDTFIGYAWNRARQAKTDLSWRDILDAYEREKGVVLGVSRLTLNAMEA